MYSEENKSSSLAKFLNGFDYVIIDTCSLMDESFPVWMDILRRAKSYRKKELEILVPRRCYDELKKHVRNKKEDSKRIDAKRGLKIVKHATWWKHLTVTKPDKAENFADNAIYVKVSSDRLFARILVITQDKKLASDLRALNALKSQSGRPLEVCKFVAGGRLVPNHGEEDSSREQKGHGAPSKTAPNNLSGVEAVLQADARLSAVVNNPNYPDEKKKADALAQLKAVEAIPEARRAQLNLLISVEQLKAIAKDAKKKPVEPKPAAPKKPAEPKPEAKDRLWYGSAKTILEGFVECGNYYGIVFHEPSVKYFPEGHGPLDLTTKDLDAIVALAEPLAKDEEKTAFEYRGLSLAVMRHGEKFRCWIDANHLPEALTPVKKKRATKVQPVAEPTAAEPEEQPLPKKRVSKKPANLGTEETPEIAPKPRKKPVKKAESSEEKPQETAEPAQPEEVKPAPKARKKATPKKAEEAPAETPAQEPVPASEAFVLAQKADRRLQANLSNPNYDVKKKHRDVKKQLEAIQALSAEEVAKLRLSPADLEAWIAANPLPTED